MPKFFGTLCKIDFKGSRTHINACSYSSINFGSDNAFVHLSRLPEEMHIKTNLPVMTKNGMQVHNYLLPHHVHRQ